MENANSNLYEALRDWRLVRSREESIPAYRILTNNTMQAIAFSIPGTPEELLAIPGIGPKTQEKYGQEILSVLRRNLMPYNFPVFIPNLNPKGSAAIPTKTADSPAPELVEGPGSRQASCRTSFTMFMDGMTVPEIARERSLSERTIVGHLCSYVESGDIDIEELTTFEVVDRVASFKAEHPEPVFLRTLHRHFNGTIPYPDLRFALAYLTYTGYIPQNSAPEPAEGPGPVAVAEPAKVTGMSEWLKNFPTEFPDPEDSAE